MQGEKADKTWRLLVKKVRRARAMASLVERQVPEVVAMSWPRGRSTTAAANGRETETKIHYSSGMVLDRRYTSVANSSFRAHKSVLGE
ncbi:hypothetical protein ACJX0J_033754, partial [Zea mays]